jgi:hypothetical protein
MNEHANKHQASISPPKQFPRCTRNLPSFLLLRDTAGCVLNCILGVEDIIKSTIKLILNINMIRDHYHDQGSLIVKLIMISDHICTRDYY